MICNDQKDQTTDHIKRSQQRILPSKIIKLGCISNQCGSHVQYIYRRVSYDQCRSSYSQEMTTISNLIS